MPYDGSGNFNRVMNWVADAAALIKIRADRHDTEDDNFASGLSNALTKDGQSQPTNHIPMNGKRLINLGPPVNPTDAVTKAYADADFVHGLPDKPVPVDADEMLLSNSASTPAWQRAKSTVGAIRSALSGFFIHPLTAKPIIVDLDEFVVADSVSTPTAWQSKRHSWLDLQTMVGVKPGQRLAKNQSAAYLASCNDAIETGWYATNAATTNGPALAFGMMQVLAFSATDCIQIWTQQLAAADQKTYSRQRVASTWYGWIEITSKDALLKKVDGVIVDAGYTQTPRVTPDAVSTNTYTPSPVGGNTRQVNAVAVPWTFNAPTFTGNYSMVVLISNVVASGAVTFAGFNKVSGDAHPAAINKWSVVYIMKIGTVVTAQVEASP